MPLSFANVGSDIFGGGPNLLTRDLAEFGLIAPQWGIFDSDGNLVVLFDNVESYEFRSDSRLPTYPLEQDGFQSFNKVRTPFIGRMTFTAGGSLSNRQELINSCATLSDDPVLNLQLYSIVTPEKTYLNCNVEHQDYIRRDGKAGFLRITLWLRQVFIVPAVPSNSPQMPSGSATVNNGSQQAQDLSTSQISAAQAASQSQGLAVGPLSGGGV